VFHLGVDDTPAGLDGRERKGYNPFRPPPQVSAGPKHSPFNAGRPMKLLEPRIKRWTRDEYYQMADLGWFRGKRVCLLSGEIYEMAGRGNWHRVGIGKSESVLRKVFPEPNFWVRPQLPIDLEDGSSDPEPDLSVVPGTPDDFLAHPSTALLAVEVSDSSLSLDRKKAAYYAAAGIPEYWIVNLHERVLEVYRTPWTNPSTRWEADAAPDARYEDRQVLQLTDSVIPVTASNAAVAVADLFPARPPGDTF
jgi:Uma2 family endonuclease